MLGSAVVATRLSSVTMKRAIETIASVQMLRRDVIECSFQRAGCACFEPVAAWLVSDCLLRSSQEVSEHSQLVKWLARGRRRRYGRRGRPARPRTLRRA